MGVPVAGISAPGAMLGWRYNQEVGLLEFRLNNLQPHEEAQITGLPIATVAVNGNTTVGDVVTITLNVGGQTANATYTVQSSDIAPNNYQTYTQGTLTNVATKLANAVTGLGLGLIGAVGPAPINENYPYGIAPNAQVIIYQTVQTAFTVTTSTTGNTHLVVAEQGTFIGPQITFNDDNVTCYGYLAICEYLQSKMAQTSDNLSLSQADVMKFRQDEHAARKALWMDYRKQLAQFLGVKLNALKLFKGANTGFAI